MQSLAHSNQDAFQVATDAQCGEPLEATAQLRFVYNVVTPNLWPQCMLFKRIDSMAETILVVGFYEINQQLVVWDLLKANYQVRYATLDSVIDIVSIETPSAVLLTQVSAKVKDVCSSIRRVAPKLPLIIIGRENDPDVRLKFFQVDADDYIREPFDPVELIARIRSAVRRSTASDIAMTEEKKILASEISALLRQKS
jgi:DNA-binding response OmpR family regulator